MLVPWQAAPSPPPPNRIFSWEHGSSPSRARLSLENQTFIISTFLLSSRHIASFLSMFKLVVIGLIIVGKDPFALFGMQAPGIWEWGQGNKVSLAHAASPPAS